MTKLTPYQRFKLWLPWYKRNDYQKEHCARWSSPVFIDKNQIRWKPWFAWYPVFRVSYTPLKWVWLKWVWRSTNFMMATTNGYQKSVLHSEYLDANTHPVPCWKQPNKPAIPFFGEK